MSAPPRAAQPIPSSDDVEIHPLAHAYYTQGVFRYGDYVAKVGLYPGTAEQAADNARRGRRGRLAPGREPVHAPR